MAESFWGPDPLLRAPAPQTALASLPLNRSSRTLSLQLCVVATPADSVTKALHHPLEHLTLLFLPRSSPTWGILEGGIVTRPHVTLFGGPRSKCVIEKTVLLT